MLSLIWLGVSLITYKRRVGGGLRTLLSVSDIELFPAGGIYQRKLDLYRTHEIPVEKMSLFIYCQH